MTQYEIRRFYQKAGKPYTVIAQGLTLEEAKRHCNDPQTTNTEEGWYDGFTKEYTDLERYPVHKWNDNNNMLPCPCDENKCVEDMRASIDADMDKQRELNTMPEYTIW